MTSNAPQRPHAGDPRETVVRRGKVTAGWFRARPSDPDFGGGSTIQPIVVFPRTAVGIRHRRREEVVADPTTAMLYNSGDVYHRRPIDPTGDRCEWLSIPHAWWVQVCAECDPDARLHDRRFADGRVFTVDHCPLPAAAYLAQRRLTSAMLGDAVSTLEAEETTLMVLRAVLATGSARSPAAAARGAATRQRHRELVHDTREFLAATVTEDVDLEAVAHAVGAAPHHLHRLFRRHTGSTIHQHRTELRLRTALDWLPDRDLAAIAHDLGFSSHSHFTATFRRCFDHTPSDVRVALAARRAGGTPAGDAVPPSPVTRDAQDPDSHHDDGDAA